MQRIRGVAELFALQWQQDGLIPFIVFRKRDHRDGEILSAQEWLSGHFSVAHPECYGASQLR